MSTPLVDAVGVNLSFDRTPVLDQVDLTVDAGERLALTGRSGSGKSTLLLVLAGLIPPSSGTVTWPGLSEDPIARRGQIGMVFQAPSLLPELTAAQNIQLPLRLRGMDVESAELAASAALATVWADDLSDALPGQLSGGQQQRVAVARVLAGQHRLVLADEPTGSLDRAHAHSVVRALVDGVVATGGSLVLATHDPELVALFVDRVSMSDGALSTVRQTEALA